MLGSVALYIFGDILPPNIEKSTQVSGIAGSLPPQHDFEGSVTVVPGKLPKVSFSRHRVPPREALPIGVALDELSTALE